jgi:hypothetical protein
MPVSVCYVLDKQPLGPVWHSLVPEYLRLAPLDNHLSDIVEDAVVIVHLSYARKLWKAKVLDVLLEISSVRPQPWIIVVSGSGINQPEYKSSEQLYFRRAAIGKETDSAFKGCFHHFLQSLNEGNPRVALLEPQRKLLAGLLFLLTWRASAPALPLPPQGAHKTRLGFQLSMMSLVGLAASDIDQGIGILAEALQQETTTQSATAIAELLKADDYTGMKAAIEAELQRGGAPL